MERTGDVRRPWCSGRGEMKNPDRVKAPPRHCFPPSQHCFLITSEFHTVRSVALSRTKTTSVPTRANVPETVFLGEECLEKYAVLCLRRA